jgi:phosphatidate cytidylyltransferase
MLLKRITTAAILIPLFVVIIWFGNPWFTIGIAIIAVMAGWEFYRIAFAISTRPATYFGLFIILLLPISIYCPVESIKLIIIVFATIVSCIWILFKKNKDKAYFGLIWTLAGILYIGLLISYWANLMALDDGKWWVAWAIIIVIACDTAAYFTGRQWGKHKLAPQISPKKTWEGSAAGLIASILVSVLLGWLFGLPQQIWELVLMGIVISVIGQCGDLVESFLKRTAGVKDSGNLLPGHGGILDRIDSYILLGPVIYYYVIYFAL